MLVSAQLSNKLVNHKFNSLPSVGPHRVPLSPTKGLPIDSYGQLSRIWVLSQSNYLPSLIFEMSKTQIFYLKSNMIAEL